MLDNILEGRFVFGISPGGLPSDWEMFGNLDVDRREKFAECIDQILGIWAGEAPYTLEGKYWTISTERTQIPEIGQGLIVKPYQKPHPPIVVAVVEPSSASAANAAARGWDIISANFLLPQFRKVGNRYVIASPAIYARICNAIVGGVRVAGSRAGVKENVACGATNPRGKLRGNGRRDSVAPLLFLREMKKAGARFDVYAHHPSVVGG